ncbi:MULTISPECIES: SMP-30/gluconolactonase/LRE family protein [unclassified Paenibacillus]|uniref:SMP-30/gluconolactonase/LRE family protein n=1 Tax=unclassified Paenibacillus TaxID=185978 RepID=UPI002F4010D3
MTIKPVAGSISQLGEGPVWLEDEGVFYWVDIIAKQIRFYYPATEELKTIQLNDLIGAAVPAGRGSLICAMKTGFYRLELASQQLSEIGKVEEHLPDNRMNDGKCDRSGRFWAGTMSMKGETETGALYCLERDSSVRQAVSHVSISNGICWSSDDTKMYYIDTPTREIHQFDYNAETGELSNRKAIITIEKEQGFPDGMTIDAEGMLWVAHWGGACVSRWNPATAKQVESISVPATNITSCCFGGDNLDQLFITSAKEGLSEEHLLAEPLAGSCFIFTPGVKGLPAQRYKSLQESN